VPVTGVGGGYGACDWVFITRNLQALRPAERGVCGGDAALVRQEADASHFETGCRLSHPWDLILKRCYRVGWDGACLGEERRVKKESASTEKPAGWGCALV
jgi:hypothetical protein